MTVKEFQKKYYDLLSTPMPPSISQQEKISILTLYLTVMQQQLPPFPSDQYARREMMTEILEYQGKSYKKSSKFMRDAEVIEVDPARCVGNVWLFANDHSDGRPIPDRLARCLFYNPDTAPPIWVAKMGDYWYCDDGCHRIYAAYLLGRKVKIIADHCYEEM